MKINYTLSENDMITYQLYLASTSSRIVKKRFKNKMILPLIYLVTSAWYYYDDKRGLSIIFLFLIPLWYFLYPIWERRHYVAYYRSLIEEHFKSRIGRNTSLELKSEIISAKDDGIETQILPAEIAEIVELPEIILLKLKTGEALVIPQRDAGHPDIKQHLETLAWDLKINYKDERDWRWR